MKHEPAELCLEFNPGPCGECGADDGQEVVKGTFLCEQCCVGPAGHRIAQNLFDTAARVILVEMGVDAAEVAEMDNDEVGERGVRQLELSVGETWN